MRPPIIAIAITIPLYSDDDNNNTNNNNSNNTI